MKLELKHLAPYLPYGLWVKFIMVKNIDSSEVQELNIHNIKNLSMPEYYILQPILKPLSEITDDIFKESGFADELDFIDCIKTGHIPYKDINLLFKDHYDVFGLINNGLALPYLKESGI